MIALQLTINGKLVQTAGIEDWDSLYAILNVKNGLRGQATSFDFNLGGSCKATDPCRGDAIRWASQYLDINDEVSIKIIETDSVDPPIQRLKRKDLEKKYDPKYTSEELEAMDRDMYRKLKHKFEKHS